MLKGLDLSHHNGVSDMAKVKAGGASFVILKATEGTQFTDPVYHSNLRAARAAGLKVASYHYFKATWDAQLQFEHFNHVTGGKQGLAGDLVPALDVEEHGSMSPADYSKSVQKWLDLAEVEFGRKCLFYTFPDFNQHQLLHQFGEYPLWVASYPRAGLQGTPAALQGWKDWSVWQWTDHGTWRGVGGGSSVDLDVMRPETLAGLLL